jgi:tryptophan synthase alpha chain
MTTGTSTSATASVPSSPTLGGGAGGGGRISAAFAKCAAEGRAALIPFITGGYPSLAMSEQLLLALVAGGADIIEIGVPFSDPLADGTTVQATSQKSLEQGTTLQDCFDLARKAREQHGIEVPLILMGYSNPFYQYGLERLAETAKDVGVDGFIIPDLPSDESEEFAAPLRKHGRDLISLVAPTTTEARLRDLTARASGFVYCVSLRGVTGARSSLASDLPEYIARVRSHTALPLAIGFGISTPEHVRQASALADGVVVASALINYIDSLPAAEQVAGATAFTRSLADATRKTSSSDGSAPEEKA